jgi:hypothetical protein
MHENAHVWHTLDSVWTSVHTMWTVVHTRGILMKLLWHNGGLPPQGWLLDASHLARPPYHLTP